MARTVQQWTEYQPVWSSAGGATFTYTDNTSFSSGPVQPFVAVPLQPVPGPVDDSPLAWLRAQVAEVTGLATEP